MPAVMRPITFADLDGNVKTVDYWFSLGKTDAIELDFVHRKNPKQYLADIAANQESRNLMEVWKDMLFRAVAKRKGDYLDKSPEMLAEFQGSGAYEQLFNELAESEDGGAAFFLSIMPKEVQENADKEEARNTRNYSNQELLEMSDEDFFGVAGTRDLMKMDQRYMQIAWQRKNQGRLSA